MSAATALTVQLVFVAAIWSSAAVEFGRLLVTVARTGRQQHAGRQPAHHRNGR